VAESQSLKLLVIEDDLEDEELLCEALIEIEENRQWCNWRTASVVQVEQLSDALDCLGRDRFDAVLLNLSLPDSPVLLDSFLEVNACAHGTPIVVLADEEDENLANRLLREGAQDVLLKSELECAPLARSLRYAIERQRRTNALPFSTFSDDLTGALTRPGFFTAAQHYRHLSRHSRLNLILSVIEIGNFHEKTAADRDLRELLLMRTGEVLRTQFPVPAMIGRLDRRRFGLITAGLTDTSVENLLNQAVAQIEDAATSGPRQAATVSFSSAELYPEDNLEELLSDAELVLH
jgi:two-component system cell cycle response regulator